MISISTYKPSISPTILTNLLSMSSSLTFIDDVSLYMQHIYIIYCLKRYNYTCHHFFNTAYLFIHSKSKFHNQPKTTMFGGGDCCQIPQNFMSMKCLLNVIEFFIFISTTSYFMCLKTLIYTIIFYGYSLCNVRGIVLVCLTRSGQSWSKPV